MPFENRTWKFLVPVVGTLFLAAACGGGGGGGDGARSESAALTTFFADPSAGNSEDAAEENIVVQTLAAADRPPAGAQATGGVYQHASDIALAADPQILIDVDPGDAATGTEDPAANDRTTFHITIGDYTIDTTLNAAGTGTNSDSTGVDNTGLTETVDEAGFVTFVQRQGTEETPTGNLHVWLRTDKPGSVGGDEDYLAYGFWIDSVTGTSTETDDGIDQIGAFVDASDNILFPATSVTALTGTAVYIGEASGLYHEEVGGDSDFRSFTAETRLTADFDTAAEEGEISGAVNNFEFSGGATPLGADPAITLSAASLTEVSGGFFVGATGASLTLPGGTAATVFEGDWGGKFYDDRNLVPGATNYPGTVAGTFGIQDASANPDDNTMMDRRALLGVFWGDYDPDPPAVPAP